MFVFSSYRPSLEKVRVSCYRQFKLSIYPSVICIQTAYPNPFRGTDYIFDENRNFILFIIIIIIKKSFISSNFYNFFVFGLDRSWNSGRSTFPEGWVHVVTSGQRGQLAAISGQRVQIECSTKTNELWGKKIDGWLNNPEAI